MTDGIKLILTEDNTLKTYNDEYDIVIHCESQTEQDEVLAKLNGEQEPKGHWKFEKTVFDRYGLTVRCPSCHKKWKTYDEIRWAKENKYCPNCGEKMESEDTE